jgi:hypothetical protein
MSHPIWLDPYAHFEACKTDYAARFPGDDVPWAFGRNALAQQTARCRVVYCPTESGIVTEELDHRYLGLTQLSQENMPTTLEWDGVGIELHLFGTRQQLFTQLVDDSPRYGLRDKVGTVLRYSVNGPKNYRGAGKRFPATDFSTSDTALWEWVILGVLWVPVFDLTPGDDGTPYPISTVTFSGE